VGSSLKTCTTPRSRELVDLGLIYECDVIKEVATPARSTIKMTLTAPGCGMGEILVQDVREKVQIVPTGGAGQRRAGVRSPMESAHDVRGGSSADGNNVTTAVTRRVTLLRAWRGAGARQLSGDFERCVTRHGANAGACDRRTNPAGETSSFRSHLVSPAERAWSTAEIVAARASSMRSSFNARRRALPRRIPEDLEVLAGAIHRSVNILMLGAQSGLEPAREPLDRSRTPTRAGAPRPAYRVVVPHGSGSTLQPRNGGRLRPDDPESSIDFDL